MLLAARYQDRVIHKLNDKNTRYEHYRELLEMWEAAIDILENRTYQSSKEEEGLKQLHAAAFLLRKQIDLVTGFEKEAYSFAMKDIRRQIEELPIEPSEIV